MFSFKSSCEKFQDEVVQFGVSKESEHLQKCEECQSFISFFHDIRFTAKNLEDHSLNPHVLTRLQALAYEHVSKKNAPSLGGIFDWLHKLAPGMVVLLLFVGTGYTLGANHQSAAIAQAPAAPRTETFSEVGLPSRAYPSYPSTYQGLQRVAVNEGGGMPSLGTEGMGVSFEKQLEEFRKLTMESDADSLLMRGRRLKAMGKVDQALKDFESILDFYPNYSYLGDVLMYRAQCYAILGRFDEAIHSLETYLEKNPSKRNLIEPMIDQIHQTRDDGQM